MKKSAINIIHKAIVVFAIILPNIMFASNTSIKATLDSAYILMGRQTTLHVEILEDINTTGNLLINDDKVDTLISQIEISKKLNQDTIDLGNNRQINQDFIIQSFDSGLYTIPPILYLVKDDSFKSNELALKVIPVSVDSLATINGQANVIDANSKWYDFLPDVITDNWGWILLAVIIITGTIIYLFMRTKNISIPLIPQKKPIPAHELAIQQLEKLKEEKLCEKGQEKEFYTKLTDILRIYIDTRFNINAMEMTSTQIIDALKNNEKTNEAKKYMQQILEIADFVKFAKVRPLPEDNSKTFNWAIQFVQDTKPVEIDELKDENISTTENVELNNK